MQSVQIIFQRMLSDYLREPNVALMLHAGAARDKPLLSGDHWLSVGPSLRREQCYLHRVTFGDRRPVQKPVCR